jgi:hypothetical protein
MFADARGWKIGLAGAAFAATMTGSSTSPADVEAIRGCAEANVPRTSSVQTVVLRTEDAEGLVSEMRARVYWRRFRDGHRRILVRMQAPDELARAGVLAILPREGKPEVHLYLPEIGEPRRIYSPDQLQDLLGKSGIQLEEIEPLLDLARRPGLRLVAESSVLGGRPVWVVEALSEGDGASPQERMLGFVDHEYCLPLLIEFYGENGRPRKLLRADPARVTRESETWVPRLLFVEDLTLGSRSTFRVDSIEVDMPIAPGLLTVKALPGARR